MVLGAAKSGISYAVNYANEREQFGRPISKYGAIRHKLGEMAIQAYALESAVYRATQNIDDAISALKADGMEHGEATPFSVASPCSMPSALSAEMASSMFWVAR